jgi:NADPH:quinone reductase-like Zn-dependent oxidoreductase
MASNPVNENGVFAHDNTSAPEHPSLMQMFSLKGKTAIVTGAASGIGLAVAQGLAEAGANVALWWGTNTKCPERAAEIAAKYGVQSEYFSKLDFILVKYMRQGESNSPQPRLTRSMSQMPRLSRMLLIRL